MIWKNNVCLLFLSMLRLLNLEKILNGVGKILNKTSNIEDWCKLHKRSNKSKIFLKTVVNKSLICSISNQSSKDKWYVRILVSVNCCLSYSLIWRKISWTNMWKLMKEKKDLDIYSIKILILGESSGNYIMLFMRWYMSWLETIFSLKYMYQNGSTLLFKMFW